MSRDEITLDFARGGRIGQDEAIYCGEKSAAQIATILDLAEAAGADLLLTRLDTAKLEALSISHRGRIDHCPVSRTGFFGPLRPVEATGQVAILSAGTSDVPVAREAERTLRHAGQRASLFSDIGVAGLWRLTDRLDEIRAHPVVIVVAGMDAALASVVGGLVAGPVICVPTSVGYGVAAGGRAALDAMLASCAPGLSVCNIDNGYGAACAALRLLNAARRLRP
ncbi:nickel pincer cofactor biosynthesis protein LarB [Inquilinus sp. OTU3971]|uniref:nickel pincer cofactor biosynthesis protein LarB n=1 Tax=Inquilinus sp. OTU3971 TaxID=3043855 RepID=UPI00313ED6E5